MYCFSCQTFHIRTYAKIKCHATFKSSGKPDSAKVELKDIDKKYDKKENIADGLRSVFPGLTMEESFFFATRDEVIVFENLQNDCLSLVDLLQKIYHTKKK